MYEVSYKYIRLNDVRYTIYGIIEEIHFESRYSCKVYTVILTNLTKDQGRLVLL